LGLSGNQKERTTVSNAFAFALLLLHQHQAQDPTQQHRLHELFLTFLAGHLTAEQYERNLTCSTNS
jgi:hypothetical protein